MEESNAAQTATVAVPAEAAAGLASLVARFGADLAAVYLHGSAVAGGLKPRSDVDLLAVVTAPMVPEVTQALLADLLALSGHYPVDALGRRPVELMVFLADDLANFTHPVRGLFVYGEWLRTAFEAGEVPTSATHADFTLMLAQVRQTGIPLLGPPPTALLPEIAVADLRRASAQTMPELLDNLVGDERNVLLTLARAWFTAETGQFAAKDVAADWAMARLPDADGALLSSARNGYLGLEQDGWSTRGAAAQATAGRLAERALAALATPPQG